VATPALEDDFTARLFAVSVRRTHAVRLLTACIFLLLAVTYAGFFALDRVIWPVGAAAYPLYVATYLRMGSLIEPGTTRWESAMERLLATQPWRETPVLVLNTRGTVLVLPGPEYVRVAGLSAAAREVVVRTGRVAVVGPDAQGTLAVRVDGWYLPRPARRVAPVHATAALPVGEPIAAMWVRSIVDAMHRSFVATTMFALTAAIVALSPTTPWWGFLTVAVNVAAAALAGLRLRHVRRLRHTGPWVRADAETTSWHARRNGLADGTVALRFPDGRRLTAHLHDAPINLFANVAHEKTLWVADHDVVGFPHYPVVAVARLTPVT